ncbi:uncharacterized protein ycf36 [Nymphaea colorata]|nr:uncharacterized protein ycf36 [Nymphaea colorata]
MAAIPPSTATAAFTRLTTTNLLFFPLRFERSASTFLSSSSPSARQIFFLARRRALISKVTKRDREEESFSQSSDCPVPAEQQPANEYKSLAGSILFSWAAGDVSTYASRLLVIGAAFSLFVGWPIAKFSRENDAIRCVTGAVSAGILFDTLLVLRMYLGWAYVGNRLLSATVEYEETGWYDGQVWVKSPEVLARDRLLGSYAVKPVLNRVKLTLVLLAAMLVSCVLPFMKIDPYVLSEDVGGRAVAGVYNEDSARSFEPDAFCGVPDRS